MSDGSVVGVRRTFATDGGSVMLAVPGAEGEMVRTGSGGGEVRVTAVDLGSVQLARLQFGFPAVAEAVGVGDSLILCSMLRGGDGSWEGIPLAAGQTFAYGPGTTHHAADPAGLDFAMVVLPWEQFETAAETLGLDPERAASKRTINGGPWWRVASSLPFDEALTVDVEASRGRFGDRLFDAAARALCGESSDPRGVGVSSRWSDADLVAEAIAFLERQQTWHVPVLTLCRHVGTSERRLQYAFRRLLDVSPSAYMTFRALQHAHVALLDSDPATARVADIAGAHGFGHLGRFSQYYRRVYAELPSVTLRRPR